MNKFFLSMMFVLAFGGAVCAQQRKWQDFSPPSNVWTIYAPAAMQPDAEARDASAKKGSYSYNDFAGFYAVVWRDSPRRVVPWKADRKGHFKKVAKEVTAAARGKVIKERDFTAGGMTGREVYVRVPFGTLTDIEGQTVQKYRIERFRMMFREDRFYMVMAVLPESEIDSAETNRYFDSFKSF